MEDDKIRIPVIRYKYEDPEEKKKKDRQRRTHTTILFVSGMVTFFLLGWLFSALVPFRSKPNGSAVQSISKIEIVESIMENKWFFGSEIENLDQKVMDKALYGMTQFEEDIHTTYLSGEELNSFQQSINQNFVGIGVQISSSDGLSIVTRVFRNGPAHDSGVLPGDIFKSVDGQDVRGLDSSQLADLVKGEEGTAVTIVFERQGEDVELTIPRANVASTAYGEMIEDNIGLLEITNFGDTTQYEVEEYLQDLTAAGCTKLIIDLRDNGGGYLDALEHIASFFIEKDAVVMKQVYPNGSESLVKSKGEVFEQIEEIVVLVNENTASASEVLTLALREQLDDVTVVGTTTYGKGTVQVTMPFADGSAIKYTSSKWVSPSGRWINGEGITPDVEVELHPVLRMPVIELPENESYRQDEVSGYVEMAQMCLDFLGYPVDRQDGYFSVSTEKAIRQFAKELELETSDGILNDEVYNALISSVIGEWALNKSKDTQMNAALEVLRGTI